MHENETTDPTKSKEQNEFYLFIMPKHGCVLHEIQLMSLHLEREMWIAFNLQQRQQHQQQQRQQLTQRSIRYSVRANAIVLFVICNE